MSTFAYAGVSRKNGVLALRFTNSDSRFLHLVKVGHTDVEMIKLTKPQDKDSAIKELLVRGFDNGRTEITNLLVSRARGATLLSAAKSKRKNTVVVRVPNSAIQQLTGQPVTVSERMTRREAERIRAEFCERVRVAYEAN